MLQLKAALKRAAIAAVIAIIPIVIAEIRDYDWPVGYGAYIVVLVRVAEGLFDSYRNAKGDVSPEDVGAYAAPLPT